MSAYPLRRRCDLYREDGPRVKDAPTVDYDCARPSSGEVDQFDGYAADVDVDVDADAACRSSLHDTVGGWWARPRHRSDCSAPTERPVHAKSAVRPYPGTGAGPDGAYPDPSRSPQPPRSAASHRGSHLPDGDDDGDDG